MARLPANAREASLAARMLAVAAVMPLIARMPLLRQAAILEPRRPPATIDRSLEAWVTARGDAVLAAGRPVVRPGCLTRCMTLYFFLRRAGADVRLAFGVGLVDGRYEGHCWLERDGDPYLERRDPRQVFSETYRIPRRRSANA